MQQNGELSVEEILESIKKVIARDNKETAQVERYRRETEGVVLRGPARTFGLTPVAATDNDDDREDEDEILDLSDAGSEVLDDEESGVEVDGTGEEASDDPAAELIEPLPPEIEAEAEPAQLPEPALHIQTPFEQVAAPMVRHSLEALSTMPETTAEPDTAAQPAETPLERMVRESLRPLIREWLDSNLEPMVERMVKTELERIMGKLS